MKGYKVYWWHSWPYLAPRLGFPTMVDPMTGGWRMRCAYLIWRVLVRVHNRTQYWLAWGWRDAQAVRVCRALLRERGFPRKLAGVATHVRSLRPLARYILHRWYPGWRV